ncbi:MAG: hypothetical protein ACYCW6_04210 [Candidatus Xenobia bacterium]
MDSALATVRRRLAAPSYAGDWWEILTAALIPILHVELAVLHLDVSDQGPHCLADGRHRRRGEVLQGHLTSIPSRDFEELLKRTPDLPEAMRESSRLPLPPGWPGTEWMVLRWEHNRPIVLELFCDRPEIEVPPGLGEEIGSLFRSPQPRRAPCHVQRSWQECSETCAASTGYRPAGSELCSAVLWAQHQVPWRRG